MIQEDKQLLLKDLCGRLPYDPWIDFVGNRFLVTGYGHGRVSLLSSPVSSGVGPCPLIEQVKPYLRPMSSMTEGEEIYYNTIYTTLKFYEKEDWLNAHHFDFRGLIEKGLALEAPEGMYKNE